MIHYIIRRILIALIMLLAASLLGFFVMKLTPGDYLAKLAQDPSVPDESLQAEKERLGLDQPAVVQYGQWLYRFVRLDFGESFEYRRPVWQVMGERIRNTIIMNVAAIFVTWTVAIPLGVYAAVHQYKWSDKLLSGVSFMGMSLPNFFLALLMLFVFAGGVSGWTILPPGGLYDVDHDNYSPLGKVLDVAHHLVIPVTVLAIGALAGLQRITRGNMLEVLRQQYVTTARAKGLPENRVIYRHALRNAINPLITLFGYQFAALFSGAALLEIILNFPGMGQLMLTAIQSKDEPLVMAGFMVGAFMLLMGNLLADILLAVADPRISYS